MSLAIRGCAFALVHALNQRRSGYNRNERLRKPRSQTVSAPPFPSCVLVDLLVEGVSRSVARASPPAVSVCGCLPPPRKIVWVKGATISCLAESTRHLVDTAEKRLRDDETSLRRRQKHIEIAAAFLLGEKKKSHVSWTRANNVTRIKKENYMQRGGNAQASSSGGRCFELKWSRTCKKTCTKVGQPSTRLRPGPWPGRVCLLSGFRLKNCRMRARACEVMTPAVSNFGFH